MPKSRALAFAVTLAVAEISSPLSSSCAWAQAVTAAPRTIEFRFTPTARAQIALWIEDAAGTLFRTIRLTQAVSRRGIGNRPGAAQMNSGFRWPYGRREGVLPVWAHRRAAAPGAKSFRRVIFQDRQSEGFASRTSNDSSPESYFCLSFMQAMTPELRRQQALDAVTCASRFMSDKGRFVLPSETSYGEPTVVDGQGAMRTMDTSSLYPPRRDVGACTTQACAADRPDPATFDAHALDVMPDLDTVTMATPPGEVEQSVLFSIPSDWPDGDYLAWMEVNVEGDYNSYFNDKTFPTPTTPAGTWDSWAIDSGYPYRGQPSVVFQVPFQLRIAQTTAVSKPAFYGDVDGFGPSGGVLHPIDDRITDDPVAAPGQGADRLRLTASHDYRFQVTLDKNDQCGPHAPPDRPASLRAVPSSQSAHSHQWGELRFVPPPSAVAIVHYEARFSSEPISESDASTFDRAPPAVAASLDSVALTVPLTPQTGTEIEADFGGMDPLKQYYVAVRAVDACNVAGPYAVTTLTTTKINFTKLSGCFIATAAYGSELEPRVDAMRQARDDLRRKSPLFALATDLYYRSGPAAAAVISRSELARAVVRSLLGPAATLAQVAYPKRH